MSMDQMQTIMQQVWAEEANAVSKLQSNMNFATLSLVMDALLACKQKGRVLTTGVGTSGVAAKKIAHTLSCIEMPAYFLSPADAVHGMLGSLQQGDIVIAISKGGATEELTRLLPAIKSKNARLISVTENKNSPLALAADIPVIITVEREPDPFNMLATASTMAVIAVFDAIAIALMHVTGYKKEQFAVIHPGGDVGRRLTSPTPSQAPTQPRQPE